MSAGPHAVARRDEVVPLPAVGQSRFPETERNVAYGVDTNTPLTQPVYKLRVSGYIVQDGCDEAEISYTTEFFRPPSNPVPIVIPGGQATETRMLLP